METLNRRTLGSLPPRVDVRAVRRAFASYRGVSFGARAFIGARFSIAPLRVLGEEATRVEGRMPSLGCGYGAVERYRAAPSDTHAALAKAIGGCLVPGGVVIVKELDVAPRWKHIWNRVHDRIVTGPEPIVCRPPAEVAALFEDAGLVVERAERTEGRLTPYAHYVVRARKPAEVPPL